jgi:hypothetical protein
MQNKFMYRTDMPARRPLPPRRHPLASPRGRLRAAQRLAGGLRPAALARLERVAEAEVDALLARPGFQRLLAALAALEAAAMEPTSAPPRSAAVAPASPTALRQRRLDAVAARLRSSAASWVAEVQPAAAKDLLRAWAQGP